MVLFQMYPIILLKYTIQTQIYGRVLRTWTQQELVTQLCFIKNKTILMGGWNGEYLDSVEYYWGSEAPKNVKSALSIDMQSTMLSWQPVTGADSYEIQIGDREPIFTAETKVNYLISEPNDENFKVRAIKKRRR